MGETESETNYSPQFSVSSDSVPIPASSKMPSTQATASAPSTAATVHNRLPAVVAAHYPPAGYGNDSRVICTSDGDDGGATSMSSVSPDFSCVSSVESALGHFRSAEGGVGKKGVAIGAAVVGTAFAVVLVV